MNRLLLAASFVFLLAACKPDDDDDDPVVPITALDLSSQYYFDVFANPTGRSTADMPEDFAQETWMGWERDLFAPLDTARLPASAAESAQVYLYPNPSNGSMALGASASDSINCKVVLVDRRANALYRWSGTDSAYVAARFDWGTIAPSGDSLYRVYYAISTASRPYFHTSHADITIRR